MTTEITTTALVPTFAAAPTLSVAAAPTPQTFYRRWLATLHCEATRRNYDQALRDFAAYANCPLPDLAAEGLLRMLPGQANATAEHYKSHLIAMGRAASTINVRLAALTKLTQDARRLGLIGWVLDVRGLKAVKLRDTAGPGYGVYRKMLEEAKACANADKGARDCAILRLLHDTALRVWEVYGLDWPRDVDLNGQRLWILGKGRDEREAVTVPDGALEALKGWLAARGSEPGPLFVNLDTAAARGRLSRRSYLRLAKGWGRKAGVETRAHALRHGAITRACQKSGGNAVAVCAFARHKNMATTMKYIDNLNDQAGQMARLVGADD
jgi:integrase/recombinase XerC